MPADPSNDISYLQPSLSHGRPGLDAANVSAFDRAGLRGRYGGGIGNCCPEMGALVLPQQLLEVLPVEADNDGAIDRDNWHTSLSAYAHHLGGGRSIPRYIALRILDSFL